MIDKLLLIGTSSSITKYDKLYLENKKNDGYKIICYSGNSLVYLYDIDFKPDFYTFFDPYAYIMGIENMGENKSTWLKDTVFCGYDFTSFENLLYQIQYIHHHNLVAKALDYVLNHLQNQYLPCYFLK